ncbi:hypothetical protein WUBG_03005 [Wuchereria bancrofti]|uniref:Uncharacterized protein n=1 Tax=Wuchereria bancrofti TaxID=6293 RepID=J9FFI9_WUCBA|nr:hypothetical protein WUBG_03005 [Wuchereria bancrofti]
MHCFYPYRNGNPEMSKPETKRQKKRRTERTQRLMFTSFHNIRHKHTLLVGTGSVLVPTGSITVSTSTLIFWWFAKAEAKQQILCVLHSCRHFGVYVCAPNE